MQKVKSCEVRGGESELGARERGVGVLGRASSKGHAGGLLDGYRLILSVGHDEYHTYRQRRSLEAFADRGGCLAFLGGNQCFWQVAFAAASIKKCKHILRTRRRPVDYLHHKYMIIIKSPT